MYCNYSNKYNCKNNIVININNKYICLHHFNINYKKYLLKIQKIYKGYIVRKKLKNLFYNLPKDIQNIILYYIRLPIYYKRYYKSIEKIIYRNSIDLYCNTKKIDINYLIKSYYLFNKYNSIINLNILKYIYAIKNDFLFQLNNDFYSIINNYNINFIHNNYTNLQNNSIHVNESYNIDNIFNAICLLNNYSKLYETKYKLNKFIV
tara:strand:- start:2869 stop:3486 length:618 start_codon:yes stop_codon:yes gene_type:complete